MSNNGESPVEVVDASEHEAPSSKQKRAVRLPRRRVHPTPTLLQMEAVECGAAALGIILSYYDRFVPLERLRVDCGVSRDGSNAANVVDAAQAYGLVAEGYSMDLDGLADTHLPCIIFWQFNHFLVVEGIKGGRVYLNDPAYGRRTVTAEEFDKGFSGVVLEMKPGPEFTKGGQRPRIVGALAKRLSGARTAVIYCVLAGLGLVIPGLALPTLTRIFVDEILIGGSDRWLGPLLMGMVAAAIVSSILTALQQHYLMRSETKLAITATGRFLWHVIRLPIEFFTQRYAGEITSRISSNNRVADAMTGQLATSVIGLMIAILYVLIMLYYDVVLTVIGVTLAVINVVVMRIIARKQADESQRALQEAGKLQATAMGGIQCIESIKASAREADFFSRWAGYQAKSVAAEQKLSTSASFLQTIPICLQLLSAALVLGIGGWRVMDGILTIGMLVAFQTLLWAFTSPIHHLIQMGSLVQRLVGDMRRLDDVANYDIDGGFRQDAVDLTASVHQRRLSGFVELRNVTFGYNRREAPLLKNFSLRLSPGDRVALVGGSGSGKSTIAKLVSGLYRPWDGEILFDGVPRDKLPREVLANSFSMVDQDIFFYEGTVRENVSLWDRTLPDEAITRAAKDSCIHDEVASRKGGYASKVEEGGRNFSGGQRQRLEIARALSIDPTVLVMDEATSALDAATEKIVDDNIRRRGCTCVIVAHRLSTIRDANEIIVLQKGEVVQRGTHESLIKLEGAYQRLIRTE